MSHEEYERLAQTPKVWEPVPEWTKKVAALDEILHIPHTSDFCTPWRSPVFEEKNIDIWHPDVEYLPFGA